MQVRVDEHDYPLSSGFVFGVSPVFGLWIDSMNCEIEYVGLDIRAYQPESEFAVVRDWIPRVVPVDGSMCKNIIHKKLKTALVLCHGYPVFSVEFPCRIIAMPGKKTARIPAPVRSVCMPRLS